jgi:hypothetical protein
MRVTGVIGFQTTRMAQSRTPKETKIEKPYPAREGSDGVDYRKSIFLAICQKGNYYIIMTRHRAKDK